ncbi:MAG: ABC transporter permease subunit [Oligoflexales bacterium]
MQVYLIRRFLLMVPTLFGISILIFGLTQVVPGGPVERMLQQLRFGGAGGGGNASAGVTDELIEDLNRLYGFDKPVHERYLNWITDVAQLKFGESYEYHEPVLDVITQKLPVSLTFGVFTFFLVYLISIPLGVYKAVKDGSRFDAWSSFLLFFAYSIPSFALCVVFIVLFCGGSFWDIFPMQGLVSDEFEDLSRWEQIKDYFHHIFLPLSAYVVGQFALSTMMMKNSFLEQIRQDYVRTAFAKGLGEKVVYMKHVLRNALIPIATEIGEFVSIFLMGSILIEQIFGLDGIGLLNYESIMTRDYPVVLAIIMIASGLKMLGVLVSDFLYVILDPKISFD